MPVPPGQSRPHAPAGWPRAAPPRGEGQRREGAGSGGPPDLAPPLAPRAHLRVQLTRAESRGRTPTSSSSGPLGAVPVPAPVQSSTSGFAVLMVRGERGEGSGTPGPEVGRGEASRAPLRKSAGW